MVDRAGVDRARAGRAGTRFNLFPQPPWVPGYERAETVTLAAPAGTVGPGPADHRLYVQDPVGKRFAYGLNTSGYGRSWLYLPPWDGPIAAPALPDGQGQFDHLRPGRPGFEAAHVYGCIRFVIDVFERYRGRPLRWHFADHYPRLEVSILRALANATAGWGFVEIGSIQDALGDVRPFTLNFDVMAHELGHLFVLAGVGLPELAGVQPDWFGFQESAADLTALVTSANFATVLDRLFATTRGNLYALNELNRLAELAPHEQIRIASNAVRLREFGRGWTNEHDLSQPLTGAVFDTLVDIYHDGLVAERLIGREVAELVRILDREPAAGAEVQAIFDRTFDRHPQGFLAAFTHARDWLGRALALLFEHVDPSTLTFAGVIDELIAIDRELTGGRFVPALRENARWRDIGIVPVGPRLSPPDAASHAFSARTLAPTHARGLAPLTYRERHTLARAGVAPQ